MTGESSGDSGRPVEAAEENDGDESRASAADNREKPEAPS